MLQTWIHRIKPGMEPRLRAWLTELNSRADEVRQSFALAGIRAEQAVILESITGSLLVYVSEATDQERAINAFDQSSLPIDADHRQVMAECVEETLNVAPVYDVSA
jgi:hypothetical protein